MLPTTWVDVFTELARTLPEDDPFRRALSLQPSGPADVDEGLAERFSELMEAFVQGSDLEDALDHMGRRFVATRLPATRGQLTALAEGMVVTVKTSLKPHAGIIWRVEADADHATLHFHGKTVSAPWNILSVLRWIATSEGFQVGEIPGDMDDDTRCTMAQHLLDEGFLVRD